MYIHISLSLYIYIYIYIFFFYSYIIYVHIYIYIYIYRERERERERRRAGSDEAAVKSTLPDRPAVPGLPHGSEREKRGQHFWGRREFHMFDFPICQNPKLNNSSEFITRSVNDHNFCSGPTSADPICPQPKQEPPTRTPDICLTC